MQPLNLRHIWLADNGIYTVVFEDGSYMWFQVSADDETPWRGRGHPIKNENEEAVKWESLSPQIQEKIKGWLPVYITTPDTAAGKGGCDAEG